MKSREDVLEVALSEDFVFSGVFGVSWVPRNIQVAEGDECTCSKRQRMSLRLLADKFLFGIWDGGNPRMTPRSQNSYIVMLTYHGVAEWPEGRPRVKSSAET